MASIPSIAIKRPVLAWMLMAALILFGLISYKKLGVSQMPDVDFPVLSAAVEWEGAAPSVIEAEIVDRLEDALVSLEGIREISSSIRQGQATITVEFELNRDVDAALQELQAAISRVRLPLDVNPPTIRKTNPEDQPIMWIGVSGERTLQQLITYTELYLKDQFQILPGVGEVLLGGYTERNLRVWVDNKKLKKHELTILDITNAVAAGHIEAAAGRIENDQQEINLRFMGEGQDPKAVEDILITSRGGRPIFQSQLRIKDVATVEDGLADIRRISRVNGVPAVGLGIKKQRGANAVAVGDAVKARMEELQRVMPKDLKMGINFDSTVFVRESIEETEFTVILSAIVTAIICFLFLGSIWPTFNILLSIPTSIIGTLTVIYFMGFTLNFFTILGLALAIGIVVDDAIMVLENIYRHRDLGKLRALAAREGAEEIMFAAMAATVAVIAIFLPVAFMEGVIGKFFFQFAVTITAAVAFSLLEAMTLTPMRCSQFMEAKDSGGWLVGAIDRFFVRLGKIYVALLRPCIKWRWFVLLVACGIFIASLGLLTKVKSEFVPAQDQSIFLIRAQTPVGSSLGFTSEKVKEVESYLLARPEIRRVFVSVGGFGGGEVNSANLFISLVPPAERSLKQMDLMNQIRGDLASVKDLRVFMQDLSTRGFTAQRGFPVEFNIRGPDWDTLYQKSQEIIAELEKTKTLVDIDTDYRLGQPEISVWPKRELAAERGVSISAISESVNAAIGGLRQGRFTNDGRRYDVRVGLQTEQKISSEDLMQMQIRNIHGELIPITDLVEIETKPTLQTITRKNRERSISVFANVAPGKSQSEALNQALKVSQELLPEGYRVVLGGGGQVFKESFDSLKFVIWLGVLVAYMVLASQFNSFIHPVTVLLAMPFGVTGAFLALYLGGQTLNLFSMIGIILLLGIVKKNSILLVEFINQKRNEGQLNLSEAILAAAPIRLRPILMTSFATIGAALPPALAIGPGAESRIPMSITIVGGVFVSTFFTLFVVPCAYSIFAKLERKKYGQE